ncbi:MAG: FecR domain-containing protein [Dehalococcoidales bacterium]|nr:FecR domain-containing protein [Dehalococcoidales bacterium]
MMTVRAFLRKRVHAMAVVILCLVTMLPTVIMPPSAVMAEGGTFPDEPFNGMQINYDISGATVTDTSDEWGFTTSRTLSGTLGTGQLTVSGSAKMGNGYDADVSATVSCGGETDQFTTNIPSGFPGFNEESFTISVPIPAGATGGSFSISMTGHYNAGDRGLVVSGTFGADSETSVPSPTPPQTTEDPPPGPLIDSLPAVDFTKGGIMYITKVEGNPIYISADSPSLPPSQRNWVKIMPGEYSTTSGNSLFIGEHWTVRTPSGAETVMRTNTGAVYRQKERSWFETLPPTRDSLTFLEAAGRVIEGAGNFYFPRGEAGAKKYEISLNRAIVGIKGTNFVVEVTEDSDTVKVIEGSVEFTAYDYDETVTLEAGKQATATDAGISAVSSFDVDEEKSYWQSFYEDLEDDNSSDPDSRNSWVDQLTSLWESFINWFRSLF